MAATIRVLHVDDDPAFGELTAACLEDEDDRFVVETVTDAAAGLDRVAADPGVDCVVSDYDMPRTDGIEFLREVRADRPNLPFILFTGKGSEEVASEAIAAGVTDYLQKGAGTSQYTVLANRIENAVAQFDAERRADEQERITSVVRDVNRALIRAESVADLERQVCTSLRDAEPYLAACLVDVDPETLAVTPRTCAGTDNDVFEGVSISDGETAEYRTPEGRAYHEREVSVVQSPGDGAGDDRWRGVADGRDCESLAVVPLEYEGDRHGLLVVLADCRDAFDDAERQLLAELGEDVAHALSSLQTRAQLRRERDRLTALFENAPRPMMEGRIDAEEDYHPITNVNDAFADVFGYEPDAVVGEDVADVVVPETERPAHREFRERAAAGESVRAEVERPTSDGVRTFLMTVVPYGTDPLPADGWYAMYTDVTERKERKRELTELHDIATDITGYDEPRAVCRRTIDAAESVLEFDHCLASLADDVDDELVVVARSSDLPATDVTTFDIGEGIAGTVYRTGASSLVDDIRTVDAADPQGEYRSALTIPIGDHGVFQAVAQEPGAFDETDRDLAELLVTYTSQTLDRIDRDRDLQHERDRLAAIFEAIPEPVVYARFDGDEPIINSVNSAFEDTFGAPADAVRGESINDVIVPPDRHEEAREIDRAVFGEELFEHQVERMTTDGLRDFLIRASTFDNEGTLEGIGIYIDITDQQQRERELERQNERLEEFASVVSHDLRNPLRVANTRLDLARAERDSDDLAAVADALDRMDGLIDDLLTLARQGKRVSDVEPVSLSAVATDCWQSTAVGEATLDVDTDLTVVADRPRLRQVFENLFRNAVEHGSTSPDSYARQDAVEHGSTSPRSQAPEDTVEHGSQDRTAPTAEDATGPQGTAEGVERDREDVTVSVGALSDGDGFYVADDGPGIPEEEREQVFESGYTTAEDGTGFGLAIVAEIVDAHGWDVSVTESEAGGARFEVRGVEVAE